ncbi:hypothetical protein [Actinoplanes flavus]|uniref:DUF2442 domain-containing protein n=1 Tax=Actinoplanes flavus TaxID=2820290 RepID=A0ABS3USZ8_9ACTN|nr:hypothetical protein [Actinoplanes flavus]MBO3741698.1 hypothetical protein [Actinoplanes flavus]
MLVRCVKIIDAYGDGVDAYPGMTVGKSYPVLEISFWSDACYVRVVDDNGSDTIWSPDMFETADGTIPRCWEAALDADLSLRLAPKAWLRKGYWTDNFSQEPAALAEYEEGRAAVLAELAE